MAPRRGFKPRTLALTVRCSITELTRNFSIIILTLPLSVLSRIAVSYKLVGEADNHTSAFWPKRQAYYSYTISRENIWPLRLAYVYARLMTKRITAFRISPQVADQTFFWSEWRDLNPRGFRIYSQSRPDTRLRSTLRFARRVATWSFISWLRIWLLYAPQFKS